jgi:hypothetical protein
LRAVTAFSMQRTSSHHLHGMHQLLRGVLEIARHEGSSTETTNSAIYGLTSNHLDFVSRELPITPQATHSNACNLLWIYMALPFYASRFSHATVFACVHMLFAKRGRKKPNHEEEVRKKEDKVGWLWAPRCHRKSCPKAPCPR